MDALQALDKPIKEYEFYTPLQLHRGRGLVAGEDLERYESDPLTSLLNDVGLMAEQRRTATAVRAEVRHEKNRGKNKAVDVTPQPQGGQIVLREVPTRNKQTTRRFRQLYVVQQVTTSSVYCVRLDGLRYFFHNPMSRTMIRPIEVTSRAVLAYLYVSGLTLVAMRLRVLSLMELSLIHI